MDVQIDPMVVPIYLRLEFCTIAVVANQSSYVCTEELLATCCVVCQVFSLAMKHGTEMTFDQLCKVSCYWLLMILTNDFNYCSPYDDYCYSYTVCPIVKRRVLDFIVLWAMVRLHH